jgi:hypothetical protein
MNSIKSLPNRKHFSVEKETYKNVLPRIQEHKYNVGNIHEQEYNVGRKGESYFLKTRTRNNTHERNHELN